MDIGKMSECWHCGLKAETGFHRFCTHDPCPIRQHFKEQGAEWAQEPPVNIVNHIIAHCNCYECTELRKVRKPHE